MNIRLKAVLGVVFAGYAFAAQADWMYAKSGSYWYINDGNWNIQVTVSSCETNLSVKSIANDVGSGVLDLTSRITDANGREYAVVDWNSSFNLKGHLDNVTEIILPDGLSAIPNSFVQNKTALESVTIGSRIKEVGQYAFQNTGLRTLSFEHCTELTKFSRNACSDCPNLTSIVLPPNLQSDAGALVGGSTGVALNKVVFLNFPDSLNVHWAGESPWAASKIPNYQLRIYVPAWTNENGVIVGPKNSKDQYWFDASHLGNMTLWGDIEDEAVKKEYTDRYGSDEIPYALGKAESGGLLKNQWIIPVYSAAPVAHKASLIIDNKLVDTQATGQNVGTVNPARGKYEYDAGASVDCSAEQYGAKDPTLYEAYAGVLMKGSNDSDDYEVIVTNEGRSATIELSEAVPYKYVWLYRPVGVKLSVSCGTPAQGTVIERSTPSVAGGYYRFGDAATFEAQEKADGGPFVTWSVGTVQTADNPLVVMVESGLSLTAYFKPQSYSYRSDSYGEYRLSDGYNSFVVVSGEGGDGKSLSVGHGTGSKYWGGGLLRPNGWYTPYVTELDLTLPIQEDYRIVKISSSAFRDSDSGWLKSLILPSTLLKIEADAFAGAKPTVKTITFNSCPEIEENAFRNVPAGRILFLVSHKDAGWRAVINDPTQFTRWATVDAEERATWREAHPDERRPLGKHLSSGQYVRYTDYNPGFAVIVR